jgi:hypothetical protein
MKKTPLYIGIIVICFIGYVWLFFNSYYQSTLASQNVSFCLFKRMVGVPCPSCGSTGAILAVLQGDVYASLQLNPMGLMSFLAMVIIPLWVMFDSILKKDSFYVFYGYIETVCKNKKVAWTGVALVLLNWLWNIAKGR